jgi:alkylation response protein AidB-like acyl-CoA dehydrogenase
VSETTRTKWLERIAEIGPALAEGAEQRDAEDAFVQANYDLLKREKIFSAGVPAELGGGGASHAELCDIVRTVAQACGSTGLALSMHTHPVAANVFRYKRGQPAEAMLRKVAAGELVLCGTGAQDWMTSSGTMEKVEGGYRVTATKHFVSGAPGADLFVTSSRYEDPKDGIQILHFPVSMRAEGVRIEKVWKTLGMRATGSEDVVLSGVFVPEESVAVRRPAGQWHPMWNVLLPVAVPIFMAAYLGVAERAAEIARGRARRGSGNEETWLALGALENALTSAQLAWQDMLRLADDYRFEPAIATTDAVLVRKTLMASACIATVGKAMDVAGGAGFFRDLGLERLFRDVRASHFHPLPEARQQRFTGRVALGLDPLG